MSDSHTAKAGPSRLKDVAALAEVSLAAASRVLNGDSTLRITDARRQIILDAAITLDYTPTFAARALRTAKNSSIAFLVPDVTNAAFSEVLRGAEAAAAESDLTILLASSSQMAHDDDWVQRVVGQGRVDGLVLQPADEITESAMRAVLKRGMPVILLNSFGDGDVSTVRLDDELGIEVALAHLFDLGHTRIGFLSGVETNETAKRRMVGFLNAHTQREIATETSWITQFGYSAGEGRQGAQAILQQSELPTAVVIANVNAALGAIAEFQKQGLRVPEDMSVIAYHDVWYADSLWPPMTTVQTPLFEMGSTAVRLLGATSLASEPSHVVIKDPAPIVIVRSSTAPPRHA